MANRYRGAGPTRSPNPPRVPSYTPGDGSFDDLIRRPRGSGSDFYDLIHRDYIPREQGARKFQRYPRVPVPFGRALPPWARAAQRVPWLDVYEAAEGLISKPRFGQPDMTFAGYVRCSGPFGPSPSYNPGNGMAFFPNRLDCNNTQLGGQAWGGGYQFRTYAEIAAAGTNTDIATLWAGVGTPNQFMIGYSRAGGAQWEEQSSWVRDSTVGAPAPGPIRVIQKAPFNRWTEANPNLVREMPIFGNPAASPRPRPARAPNANSEYWNDVVGTPRGTGGAYDTPPAWSISLGGLTKPGTSVRPGGIIPPTPSPPPAGTRERKTFTRSKRLSIMLFKALDEMSEWAEVVDAFYEALPEQVRKRRPCKGKRGPVDNLGQYGIDHADCKLQVLYDNWHLVDFDAAVKNVLKNWYEDKIIGGIQSRLPKQAGGPALDRANKAFSKKLDEFFEWVGLSDPS